MGNNTKGHDSGIIDKFWVITMDIFIARRKMAKATRCFRKEEWKATKDGTKGTPNITSIQA